MLVQTLLAVAATAVGVLFVIGWRVADRRDEAVRRLAVQPEQRTAHARARADPPGTPPAVSSPPPLPRPDPPDEVLLFGPPLVPVVDTGGAPVPLRDWLVHLHPDNRDVWADVVRAVCAGAAADPAVAGYFPDDPDRLHKHFLTVLVMLTGDGLTAGTVERLRREHAAVRGADGTALTPEVYHACALMLMSVLRARRVPEHTLRHLGGVLDALRDVVVPAPADGDPP